MSLSGMRSLQNASIAELVLLCVPPATASMFPMKEKIKNAFVSAHGIVIESIRIWSGKGSDIYGTVEKAFSICDTENLESMRYDADGLGAGVRGDARVINDKRKAAKQHQKKVHQFRGSGVVHNPEKEMIKGRKNKDMFLNLKAQGWWSLRVRFQNTYRAVVEGMDYNPDDLISISEDIPANDRQTLLNELSQPTYGFNDVGKMKINKAPNSTKSPNAGDSVMIQFAPGVSAITDYSTIL